MIRAVLCDVYGTLLEVGPPPPDAEARWVRLWHDHLAAPDPPTLADLDHAVRRLIPLHHAQGRSHGLVQPEIDWPTLATHAYPVLDQLPPAQRPAFFFTHAQLCRSTRLADGAADFLRAAQAAGLVLGIASNAQACTRLELAASLAPAGLEPAIFTDTVCFFSYEHGVAKPDPRVFATLTARLRSLGIAPHETLLVGDRLDADITPGTAAGWHTWHLRHDPGPHAGNWPLLQATADFSTA